MPVTDSECVTSQTVLHSVIVNLNLIRVVAGCGERGALWIEELDSCEEGVLNGHRTLVRDEATAPAGRSRKLPHSDKSVLP